MTIHMLKTKGTSKTPDHLQIRNEDLILISYFKMNSPDRALSRCNLMDHREKIMEMAAKMPYGKIQKVEID
jgi:hypothetical protein